MSRLLTLLLLYRSGYIVGKYIREIIKGTLGRITKAEIIKIGGGRYTSYTWNRENES